MLQYLAGIGSLLIIGNYLDHKHAILHDIQTLRKVISWSKEQYLKDNITVADLFEQTCESYPNKVALTFHGKDITFKQLNQEANRMAHFLKTRGFNKGDTIGVLMDNSPELVITVLGAAKIGAAAALINPNLHGKSLIRCIKITEVKALVLESEFSKSVTDILEALTTEFNKIPYFSVGDPIPFGEHLSPLLSQFSSENHPEFRKDFASSETFVFTFTSGTTGFPKAFPTKHFRMAGTASLISSLGINPDDRLYIAIPIFHAAGFVGMSLMLMKGITIVLRRKFSATHFMQDIIENNCTAFEYIGELCRYLLNTPPSPSDRQHKLRLGIGLGLRGDIWDTFQTRFNIPQIIDVYAATENMATFSNTVTLSGEGKGAVGRLGTLLQSISPNKLVKFDTEKEQPIRGPHGFCIKCKVGEVGEILSKIDDEDPFRRFPGYYKNPAATNKKIIKDVFKKGDKYFRTGDLMKFDERGYLYFVDRIGDTFRWKGENVATTEVAEVLTTFPGVKETNVYGVKIDGTDGRAGMAALVLENVEGFNFAGLAAYLRKHLQSYAIPLFLRIKTEMELTSTFKQKKVELREEGFNINKVKDLVYWLNPSTQTYEPLTPTKYNEIISAKARL